MQGRNLIKRYDGNTMKLLLRFTLLCALAVPVMSLFGCGPDKPAYPVQIRGNFADAALQVVGLIEKAHNHDLEFGKDEPPNFAVDRLRTYAHDFDENFIVDYVGGLEAIVDANAENEYYQCDAELNQVLRSRSMPEVPFPSCK
jgi:hypothetical protein